MNKKTLLIKAFSVFAILLIVMSLTGCTSGNNTVPLNGYGAGGSIRDYLLIYPMAYIAYYTATLFGGYLVVGIFFLTIIVRAFGWPIYAGNIDMEVKQLKAKPELDQLNLKYANRLDQESQREKMMEQMAINKKYGINPLKSCIALPLQLVLFSAMFEVLRRLPLEGGTLSLTNTNLFGISLAGSVMDGDIPTRVLCGVLAVFTALTTLLQLKISQKRNQRKSLDEPMNPMAEQMAMVMKIMFITQPLMIGWFAASNGAMGFYYLVGNTFTLLQTIYINKKREKALTDFYNEKDKDVVEIL